MTEPDDMLVTTPPLGYLERPRPHELAHIVDVIIDKGTIVDAFARVAPIGTETLTVDSRFTCASIDTYLRFVDGVNRLDSSDD